MNLFQTFAQESENIIIAKQLDIENGERNANQAFNDHCDKGDSNRK